jgi:hypothetical protein
MDIEDLKNQIKAGRTNVGDRIPFTYHHDFYRVALSGPNTGEKIMSRAEIAQFLSEWSLLQPNPNEAYVYQSFNGAIRYLISVDYERFQTRDNTRSLASIMVDVENKLQTAIQYPFSQYMDQKMKDRITETRDQQSPNY